jgi:hypothetical protein
MLLLIAATVGSAAALDWWNTYPGSVEKGDIMVNAGIGFGSMPTVKTPLPPIQASVDYAFSSPFTLGGVFGITASKEDAMQSHPGFDSFGIEWTYTGLAFGARFGYHPNFGIPKLAVSANVVMGYYFYKREAKYASDWPETMPKSADEDEFNTVLYGINVDARYFFTKNFGIFTEVGYSTLSFATAGIALKF